MATFNNLPQTGAIVDGLMADFSGLNKLDELVRDKLKRLIASHQVQANSGYVGSGSWSLEQFDGWFSELVRKELGKTLGIVRAKAVQKAIIAGAGSSSSAVLRRMYKGEYKGNINIAGNRSRISNRHRVVPEPTGGKSGIRRPRTVKQRTQYLRELYGPDRTVMLRVLDGGRDVFRATPEGPTGRYSKATYGRRGSITPRSFFHTMQSDMEQAAQQLGETLLGNVEKWIEQAFNES